MSYKINNIVELASQPIMNNGSFNSFNTKNKLFITNSQKCVSSKCLIHNFPERELKPCIISSENTFESIMTPDIIKLCNDFISKSHLIKINSHLVWNPITIDNLHSYRFNKIFIEFINIYNSLHYDNKTNKLSKLVVVNIDYRYLLTNCFSINLGLNNSEIYILNHKKFAYVILNKMINCACLNNNIEMILKNFSIFMNKLYFDDIYNNTFNQIDRIWIKQRLLIISMNVDTKTKFDYLINLLAKDIQ